LPAPPWPTMATFLMCSGKYFFTDSSSVGRSALSTYVGGVESLNQD
jgi:hypothetical protein